MRITIHHHKHYDWEPLPPDVEPTQADISAGRVKPAQSGKWLMRVTKSTGDGEHTAAMVGENDIIHTILRVMRHDRIVLTRKEAVARILGGAVLPHHTHRSWLRDIEVHDGTPEMSESEIRAFFDRYREAIDLDDDDVNALVAAYLEPATAEHHVEHLKRHFKIKGAV